MILVAVGLTGCGPEATPAEAPRSEGGAPSGKRAPCAFGQDQSCNEDPKVSALWGRCTELGVCECKPGFELGPESRLCRPVSTAGSTP